MIGSIGFATAADAASFVSLPERYQMGYPLKILIVPGHDNEFSGSSGNGLREADLNLRLAHQIADLLGKDDRFQVTVSRERETGNYIPELAKYFDDHEKDVAHFIAEHKKSYARRIKEFATDTSNGVELKQVPHGDAKPMIAYRLYATNQWANEQSFDLILHVHFNDTYPRGGSSGEYGGYSIYVPGAPLENRHSSDAVGDAIGNRLHTVVPKSNLSLESELTNESGVIPDTKLIALGAYDTLDIPSVLVEYSYVYEPLVNPAVSAAVIPQMARATMLGLYDYFLNQAGAAQPIAYQWNTNLVPDSRTKKPDVAALQLALRNVGLYPPLGKTAKDCPVTGAYGPCTKTAVIAFQKSRGLTADGLVGPGTRSILNSLFPPN